MEKYLSHFTNIFVTSSKPSSFNEALLSHQICISDVEGSLLTQPPSTTEIIHSIKSFKPLKAPGPDGIHPFFYQKFIHNSLPSIQNLFTLIFSLRKFLDELNNTLVALIPKTHVLETINQYMSISLCNTIYKIFTNIIVNRLRPHLNNIIDPLQSSFLPKRRA